VVVNDVLGEAIERVSTIIDAESFKRERVHALDEQVSALIARLEQQIVEYQRTHTVPAQ
jgi:hypothetical protein